MSLTLYLEFYRHSVNSNKEYTFTKNNNTIHEVPLWGHLTVSPIIIIHRLQMRFQCTPSMVLLTLYSNRSNRSNRRPIQASV